MSVPRTRIAWQDGDARVQQWIERWADGDPETRSALIHETDRRLLYRLESRNELELAADGKPVARAIVVKIHRTHSGPHRRREALKRRVGYSPPLREWRALSELHRLGICVPEPLAWGLLPSGDALIVTGFCEGGNAAQVLERLGQDSARNILDRVLQSVRTLHEAGYRHGDLHLGNLLVAQGRIVLLDLQRARPVIHAREQLRDVAQLRLSLARAGFSADLRSALQAPQDSTPLLDSATRRINRDFMRGRGRKQLRVGGDWAEARIDTLHGRFDQRYALADIREAIEFSRAQPSPDQPREARSRIDAHQTAHSDFIIKRSESKSRGGEIVNALRGTSATRAFRRGQQLALLGPLGARPVAAFDDQREWPARTSWLVLERVGSQDLDRYRPESEEVAQRCLVALANWIADWQASGVEHLDLKGSNIRIDAADPAFRFWLVDLVDIRFRRRLGDRARLRSLVQLNASLADHAFSAAARRSALEAYLSRLPFEGQPRDAIIRSIAKQSLARNHRWKGDDCPATWGDLRRD